VDVTRLSERRRVTRVDGDTVSDRPDDLAVEEPLEIRVDGAAVAVTMRTPGHDLDLALGFLLTEGIAGPANPVRSAVACAENVVDTALSSPVPDLTVTRNFYTSSSCGMCGKASIDAIRAVSAWSPTDDVATISSEVLVSLPERLRTAQKAFERTGGLHAAALFTTSGELLCVREDVGRHNAVDKVIGWALAQQRLPLRGTVLQVSGRASFELVQKALMAGIPILTAVSAPSSLAAQLAADAGMTLVGFLRGTSFNVYADAGRVRAGVRV
jgi:FdhD protein